MEAIFVFYAAIIFYAARYEETRVGRKVVPVNRNDLLCSFLSLLIPNRILFTCPARDR